MSHTITFDSLPRHRKALRPLLDMFMASAQNAIGLIRPELRLGSIFGRHAAGCKESPRDADAAFAQLAKSAELSMKTFGVSIEISSPIEFAPATVELHPYTYTYAIQSQRSVSVQVTKPLMLVPSFPDYSLAQFRKAAAKGNRSEEALAMFVVHFLAMHTALTKNDRLKRLFADLRFNISTEHLPEFGEVPIACLRAPADTLRPPDEVILEFIDFTGEAKIEEVLDTDSWAQLADPWKTLYETHTAGSILRAA